jgi:hypothetical protein
MDTLYNWLAAAIREGAGNCAKPVPPERVARVHARVVKTCAVRGYAPESAYARNVARIAGYRAGLDWAQHVEAQPRMAAQAAVREAKAAAAQAAAQLDSAQRAAALMEFNEALCALEAQIAEAMTQYRRRTGRRGGPPGPTPATLYAGAEAARACIVLGSQDGVAARHKRSENALEQAKCRLLKRLELSPLCLRYCKEALHED